MYGKAFVESLLRMIYVSIKLCLHDVLCIYVQNTNTRGLDFQRPGRGEIQNRLCPGLRGR